MMCGGSLLARIFQNCVEWRLVCKLGPLRCRPDLAVEVTSGRSDVKERALTAAGKRPV